MLSGGAAPPPVTEDAGFGPGSSSQPFKGLEQEQKSALCLSRSRCRNSSSLGLPANEAVRADKLCSGCSAWRERSPPAGCSGRQIPTYGTRNQPILSLVPLRRLRNRSRGRAGCLPEPVCAVSGASVAAMPPLPLRRSLPGIASAASQIPTQVRNYRPGLAGELFPPAGTVAWCPGAAGQVLPAPVSPSTCNYPARVSLAARVYAAGVVLPRFQAGICL